MTTAHIDSLSHLIKLMQSKAPGYLDLMTAETDRAFETAFDAHLEACVRRLEGEARELQDLDEDGISAFVAAALTIPGLVATRQANCKGLVDITITLEHCSPVRTKLAEAKIWKGPEYHIKGMKQLLGRYTTGREGRGLVISYVKTPKIKALFAKLLDVLNAELPCEQQGVAREHTMKWSLLSVHHHSSGEDVEVTHVGCNLHV